MKKFLTIVKVMWQRALTYRFTVVSYRIGEMAEVAILIVMWSSIYANQQLIRGYTLREMISYILIGNLINVMVRNWLSGAVAEDIKDGKLSLFLVRPMPYFKYMIFREIGRISLAFFMSVVSQFAMIMVFAKFFIVNNDLFYISLILAMVVLAFVTDLLISFLIGLITFWTTEVDGLYASINRLTKFFAGGYFPLNLLPAGFAQTSFLLPFAYSFFVPAQLYLKKFDIQTGLEGILVQVCWIFLLYLIIKFVWKKGLRVYEGVGI